MILIDIKNLHKEFVTDEIVTKVLHGIDLEIKSGEFVAIMGPSGSGKSTLMHILSFLDRPTSGDFKFKDHNVTEFDDIKLAHLRNSEVGFVFQQFNLLPRTSVFDNVKLPLTYSKKVLERKKSDLVDDAIKAVGLDHRKNNLSNQLSGGEKQRVAIARALVNDPDVIFADEPTGNLDSKSGAQVMEILEKLSERGKTIILVTHELYTAEYAERIIKLKDGVIVSDSKEHKRRKRGLKK
ncbi:MAG: macrolide ABC transporter ATP-binding protein [Parcubacteria group bacterium CG1_02_41_12]|nr:MAG: macrolide ABC transporter ATP-binding protein [Parcubacteria group bacterium CG1_02_41_12]PIP67457.1 MAG: macrolide ABC transporter ATP-binding protein [Parcubacteria group bacterium CG22_combo_CG10-13_8_21_14_all_41_9]PIQ80440.1 MAG: macrolide ABC transporter ATP-binding protein [Parcubacteria group bacterium CG11_big_fil_rev_8_21_14_0_20_41_14]PIR56995.1 MAG: macrolide ABC transporter ATP-binding protein [Parcubacteria group bacterium CG10_big_fil_rev_8_21_14_0_10_41_35]PIZ81867.1 MAG